MNAPAAGSTPPARPKAALWKRLVPWAITVLCFGYLYTRIAGAAARETPPQDVIGYMGGVFASVSWTSWLALMIPYSFFFLLIDTAVLWRVVNWFNARVAYRNLLPLRASTYIISILNEQVGKGAIAWYLTRREGVPGWQIASSMLFIMFCEFYYLLAWATIGITLRWNELPEALQIFRIVPWIALGAVVVFAGLVAWFRRAPADGPPLLHSFRQARVWQYLVILLMRSPALLAAVFVYAAAARLFGVEIGLLEMLAYLPLIFFGTLIPGPFRAVAVTMWPTLFPGNEGQMAAFGFVQHNFFVLFNAGIGLIFLRRVNRELFEAGDPGPEPAEA